MTKHNKVCVVTTGVYSSYRIVAVFSTREKAKTFMATYPDNDYNDIESFPLDPYQEEIRQGIKRFDVRMDKDGNIDYSYQKLPNGGSPKYSVSRCGGDWMVFWVGDAVSLESAIKQCNESRIRLIAEGKWPETRRA